MLKRLRTDEQGMTLVISMFIVFIVMVLATVVINQAIHNSYQAGFDRQRLQSVDAAEAGLDYIYNQLEQTPAQSLSTSDVTGTVAISPGTSSYTVHPTFYSDSAGTTLFSGTPSDTNYPSSVKLVATGTTNGRITRKMETFMVIHPTSGGFQGAVLTGTSATLVNSFSISGNNGNDGDITVNCDTTCNLSATSGNQIIKGNLYVPKGSLTIGTSVHVYGDVWANGSVTVNHPQAQIDGNIISSTSSVTVTNGHVNGTGYYCTTISGAANISGGTVSKCQGAPPAQTFPHVTFDDTYAPSPDPKWTTGCSSTPVTNCYQLQQFSGATACTLARNYVEGTGAGTFNGGAGVPDPYTGVVVRILNTCTYNPSNNAKITVAKNLAIVSNGPISLSQQTTWTGSNGSHSIHFIIPWPQTCDGSGNPGVNVGNNTNFDATLSVGIYTPCTATMSNQNAFYGQVVGGAVSVGNNWSMNYRPIIIPGAHVTGFTEDIAYIREVS
jgi:Tfp pilus assembly protein PilE